MTRDETPAVDAAHADVGIVCALRIELAPFLARCDRVRKYTGGEFTFRGGRYEEVRVAVAESGIGFAPARRATLALVEAHTPTWVVASGFAAGLKPGIAAGHIVVADSIVDEHGHEHRIDLKMPPDPEKGLHVGRFVTADRLVRTAQEKAAMGEQFDAIAVDLESLAVAQVCEEKQIPYLAVRVITDDVHTDVPPEVLSVIGPTGSARLGAALGAVWKRPSSIREMWHLREIAHRAADRLATFLEGVVLQLYEARH